MDLTNVKEYLENYFKRNIFDFNKYDNQDTGSSDISISKLLSGSCATSNYIVELSNGNNGSSYTNADGEECTKYPNGITECIDENGATTTCTPNGTCVTTTSDGCVITTYPDGTIIKECDDPFLKEILYLE